GFDLATVHEETWDGRPAYVIGARAGDVRTRQFWVDKERLLFVRLLEPGQRDTTRTSDTRFNEYRPVGAAWVSAEVAFLVDGRQRPRWCACRSCSARSTSHSGRTQPCSILPSRSRGPAPRRWGGRRSGRAPW